MILGRIINCTTNLSKQIRPLIRITKSPIMSTPSKVFKSVNYIGTHDGTFHCDDVTACFMLKQLDRFKDHDIVRTRDQELLDKAEIVVDVGSVLDVEKLRLDHHQRSFNQTIHDYFPKLKTTNPTKPPRLSSSGLVYSVFGKDLIRKLLNIEEKNDKTQRMIDAIFEKAYVEFFEEIDAIDNGVEIATGADVTYNYHINSGISSRVARLNPISAQATPEDRLAHFHKAMKVVGAEITEGIQFLGNHWWPQQEKFKEIIEKRHNFDESGQIVKLDDGQELLGWKSAFVNVEEELGIVGQLKYIVYKGVGDKPQWRTTAVPVNPKSFLCRVPLKEEWRGKRDEDLQSISGIPDASFVHMSGFTGGAHSEAGIRTMVRKTLGLE